MPMVGWSTTMLAAVILKIQSIDMVAMQVGRRGSGQTF
jgi:hypothetical protein